MARQERLRPASRRRERLAQALISSAAGASLSLGFEAESSVVTDPQASLTDADGAPTGSVMEDSSACSGADPNRQFVEGMILDYLRSLATGEQPREFYLERTLNDFPVESLELFELMMQIEDAIGVDVSDDVLDASLTVSMIVDRICSQS